MVQNLRKILVYAAQLQDYERHPPKVLKPDEYDILDGILRDVLSIDPMTPKIEKTFNLRAHLEVIVGNFPTVKHEYHFPDPYPDKAAAVLEKFEAINWGAQEEEDVEEVPTSPTDSKFSPGTLTKHKGAISKSRRRTPSPTKPVGKSTPLLPKPDHPIFGINGVMRGILISNGGMRSYSMDTRFPSKSGSVAGHNGLSIGDWWPLQFCALRDGAHGAKISGIAGSKLKGAFSIVVSGTYDQLDADRGNTLYYSGSQALENTNPEVPIISMYTEAMRLSFQLRQSIRVLRCSRSNSPFSPSKGIRYDGLYLIIGEETRFNAHGGAYIRFLLERKAGQAEIDLTRPTVQEKRLFDRVRAGY